MTEGLNPVQEWARIDSDLYRYSLGMSEIRGIEALDNKRAWKDRRLKELSYPLDPELKLKVGTPEFFMEVVGITAAAFKTESNNLDTRLIDGKVQLLKNITHSGDEPRLPKPEEVIRWADEADLPTHFLGTIMTAAGYDEDVYNNPLMRQRNQESMTRFMEGVERYSTMGVLFKLAPRLMFDYTRNKTVNTFRAVFRRDKNK